MCAHMCMCVWRNGEGGYVCVCRLFRYIRTFVTTLSLLTKQVLQVVALRVLRVLFLNSDDDLIGLR